MSKSQTIVNYGHKVGIGQNKRKGSATLGRIMGLTGETAGWNRFEWRLLSQCVSFILKIWLVISVYHGLLCLMSISVWCMHLWGGVCVFVHVQDCVFSDKTECPTGLESSSVSWTSLFVTAVQKSGGWGRLSMAEPLILGIINTLLVQSGFQSNSLWIPPPVFNCGF